MVCKYHSLNLKCRLSPILLENMVNRNRPSRVDAAIQPGLSERNSQFSRRNDAINLIIHKIVAFITVIFYILETDKTTWRTYRLSSDTFGNAAGVSPNISLVRNVRTCNMTNGSHIRDEYDHSSCVLYQYYG